MKRVAAPERTRERLAGSKVDGSSRLKMPVKVERSMRRQSVLAPGSLCRALCVISASEAPPGNIHLRRDTVSRCERVGEGSSDGQR